MSHTANPAPPQRPLTDLICPYRPLHSSPESPRPLASPRHRPDSRRRPLATYRRILTVPLKRSMTLELDQNPYDASMSIPKLAPGIQQEESIASPTRDAFYASKVEHTVEGYSAQSRFQPFHRSRGSASTSASASPDSSPTATASIAECASTPGTSPDTPASSQSYSYPSLSSMAMRSPAENKLDLRPPNTPMHKKPRNLKNLAVNTSSAFALPRAVSTASLSMEPPNSPPTTSSLPMSPAFALPPVPPRRRPSGPGLTIKTPASDSFSLPEEVPKVPQVASKPPMLARPEALRHFQSTPSLPLNSALFPPEGGMRLPTITSSLTGVPSEQDEDSRAAAYDVPQSQEEKPAAYPDGPICIYDPQVDLYFEPTAEEASMYDVIFNVASEVKNPFNVAGISNVVSVDLKAVIEALKEPSSSPSTPKAGAPLSTASDKADGGRPEYIHVPWEHNTDIVPGASTIPPLFDIVRVIDSRVKAGKRVLIHCQCGVSRSASLIVAYGLYKNPSITVQEAYDAVKKRSEWIGPNMNLIMQLQEFRNILIGAGRSSLSHQAVQKSSSGKVLHGRATPGGVGDSPDEMIPQTAPLPLSKAIPPPVNTQNIRDVSPGPSSAPSDFHWPPSLRTDSATPSTAVAPTLPETALVDASGQVLQKTLEVPDQQAKGDKQRLAIRTGEDWKSTRSAPQGLSIPPNSLFFQQQSLESPRSGEFAMTPVRVGETDEGFGITSPRPIEFTPSPTFTGSPVSPNQGELESLSSPRATEFAMTPVHHSDYDPTFGLTSPRNAGFTTLLPHRPSESAAPRLGAVHPAENSNTANALARAELRSQLGLNSTRSTNDMHAEYTRPQRGTSGMLGGTTSPAPPPLSIKTAPQMDLSDALMSPRASEFTANPFHSFAGEPSTSESKTTAGGASDEVTPIAMDPRSPPLKGGNPIVRNIMDVL